MVGSKTGSVSTTVAHLGGGAYPLTMESRAQLRAELTEAIARVRSQIGVDQRAMRYRAHGLAFNRLRQTLADLEEALANLDARGA